MSSTDDARLRRFFERRLAKAAAELRARGVCLIPRGPEPEAETWYEDGPQGDPEFITLDGIEECERALRDLWHRQQLPELAELAGPLIALARRLEVREEDTGEISPFVYVMY